MYDESGQWKGHVVSDALAAKLKTELTQRSKEQPEFQEKDLTPDDEVFFDLPGICLAERSMRHLTVDGMTMHVPSQDLDSVLYDLRLLQPRTFADGTPYYKLHGWRFCVVFTPEEREAMLTAMEAQREEANREADADDKRFVETINQINERAGRTAVMSAKANALSNPKKDAN